MENNDIIFELASKYAKQLGLYHGTCRFVLESQDILTKEEIITHFQRVYIETTTL